MTVLLDSPRRAAWSYLGSDASTAQNAAEVLALGGADYQVRSAPLYYGLDLQESPTHKATVRDNPNGGPELQLGIVGKTYEIYQNLDSISWLDYLIANGDASYNDVGVLGLGERMFVTVKFPKRRLILTSAGVEDATDLYLLVTTGHNGNFALDQAVIPNRIWCGNALTFSIRNAERAWTFKHTRNIHQRHLAAQSALDKTFTYWDEWSRFAVQLSKSRITDDAFQAALRILWPVDGDSSRTVSNNADRIATVTNIYNSSPQMLSWRGTKWGAVQAVTTFIDHQRGVHASSSRNNSVAGYDEGQRRALGTIYSTSVQTLRDKAVKLIVAAS